MVIFKIQLQSHDEAHTCHTASHLSDCYSGPESSVYCNFSQNTSKQSQHAYWQHLQLFKGIKKWHIHLFHITCKIMKQTTQPNTIILFTLHTSWCTSSASTGIVCPSYAVEVLDVCVARLTFITEFVTKVTIHVFL